MDIYETLRCMLDAYPTGAPAHPAINKILRLLFTDKEVRIAVHMSFKTMSPAKIAKNAGLSETEVKPYLDSMSEKCVIFSRQTEKGMVFRLLPTINGLCEHSLQKAGENPLHTKLRDLWKEYRDNGMIESMTSNAVPSMRVLPVGKTLNHSNVIYTHEAVSNLISDSKTIAVYNCGCRITEQNCNAPIETCFVFGSIADFLIDRSFARKVTQKEALEILDMTEQAGLIHIGNNSADKTINICNCCSCCCLFLRGLLEFDNPQAVASSSFVSTMHEELCTDCGTCSEQCHVNAIIEQDGIWHIQEDMCLGCGLCASNCPSEAIEMKRKEGPPTVPSTLLDLSMKILVEKGKLDEFTQILQK